MECNPSCVEPEAINFGLRDVEPVSSVNVEAVDRVGTYVVVVVATSAFDGILFEESSELGVVETNPHTNDAKGRYSDKPLVATEPVKAAGGGAADVAVFVGIRLGG